MGDSVSEVQRDAYPIPHRRKLDSDLLRLIASLAGQDWTLREIAAEARVCHETVRAVLRGRAPHRASTGGKPAPPFQGAGEATRAQRSLYRRGPGSAGGAGGRGGSIWCCPHARPQPD